MHVGWCLTRQCKLQQNFIQCTENCTTDDFAIEIGANQSLLLALLDQSLQNPKIVGELRVFILFDKLCTLPKLNRNEFGQIAVFDRQHKVQVYKSAMLVDGAALDCAQLSVQSPNYTFHRVVEY